MQNKLWVNKIFGDQKLLVNNLSWVKLNIGEQLLYSTIGLQSTKFQVQGGLPWAWHRMDGHTKTQIKSFGYYIGL